MPSKTLAVIPARLPSQRLPGKMLLKETGKYLVQHVYEQVRKAKKIDRVLVATDDDRIAQAVTSFGGEVVMTRADHDSGTSRVAEAAQSAPEDLIVNVQGDEPEMDPTIIDAVVDELHDGYDYVTAATPFPDARDMADPNKVKAVVDSSGMSTAFTRSSPTKTDGVFLHIGIYGFRKSFLNKFVALPPTRSEKSERLEQLRAIENGYAARVVVRPWTVHGGIDTQEDYKKFVARYKKS